MAGTPFQATAAQESGSGLCEMISMEACCTRVNASVAVLRDGGTTKLRNVRTLNLIASIRECFLGLLKAKHEAIPGRAFRKHDHRIRFPSLH